MKQSPTKKNISKTIIWKKSKGIVFTKSEVVDMVHKLLNKGSGEIYLPCPSARFLGQPRGNGLRVLGHSGIMITNNKIHYFSVQN